MATSVEPLGRHGVLAVAGAIIFTVTLFLVGIGAAPVLDRDESAYAEAAREMSARGDWIATWLNGKLWFDKPPLVYWAEMASYSAFGVSETAARFPSALFGVAGVLAVCWAGRRLRNLRTGILAGFVLATSVLYLGLARAALLDVPFTACCALALGAMIAGTQEPERARWPLWAGAALGLAVLAKSPSACALFALVLLAVGITQRSRPCLRGLRWGYAALVCVAVVAPWYAAMYLRFGQQVLSQLLIGANVGRFMQAEHARSATPIYYLPVIIVGLLPWTGMLPRGLSAAWRDRRAAAVPLWWAVLTFLFFSASGSKLPGYILPIFPALALLIAFALERGVADPFDNKSLVGVYWASGVTFIIAGIFFAYALARAAEYLSAAALLACLGLLPLSVALWAKKRAGLAVVWASAFALCAAAILGYWLVPSWARGYSAKRIGLRIRSDHPRRIYLVNMSVLDVPSVLFYSRRSVISVSEPPQAPAVQPGDAFIIRVDRTPRWFAATGLRRVASAGRLRLLVAPAEVQPSVKRAE